MNQEIPIEFLLPHPENCNHMDEETREKLKRHIMKTGRYEPVTARPHPQAPGKYQVINGHHRLLVLKELGHTAVNCSIWDIDDNQTRLYLASLNRLSGKDIPERRIILLEKLMASFELDELAALLPDPRNQLVKLEQMFKISPEDFESFKENYEPKVNIPVMLSFMLEEGEVAKINEALNCAIEKSGDNSRSGALLKLAVYYLQSHAGT